MKKLFITGVLLCSAIILIGAQTGFAWTNVNQGCLASGCHSATQVHGVAAHGFSTGNCAACHTAGAGQKGNVLSSTCAGCHSGGEACPLIATPHGNPQACLACHTDCQTASTTTTTAGGTTTTTVPSEDCITIAPASVTVSGTDVEEDVVVTFTRTDIIGATQEQLDKLVIEVDDSCAQYITINSSTINIGATEATADLNITVQGDAPASTCSIKVSDPQSAFDPPLNCTATFTIFSSGTTTTTVPPGECSVTIDSGRRPLKAGLLPSLWRIAIIGDGSNFNRSTAVSIEDINIVIPTRVQNPEGLIALIVIPSTLTGFQPGTKAIGVATGAEVCTGTVEIE